MHPVRITLRIALLLAGIGALCGACNPRSAPALSGPAPALPSLPAPPAIPADSLAGTEPAQPYLIAGLIKTPCFGNCPAYEAWVYSDGTVLWCGEAHVDRLGTFRATVPPGWLDALFREAENASFWQLSRHFPENGKVLADVPYTITYLNNGKKARRIVDNADAPPALLRLESFFSAHLETLPWTPYTP